jgi:hypothetical protein
MSASLVMPVGTPCQFMNQAQLLKECLSENNSDDFQLGGVGTGESGAKGDPGNEGD